MNAIGLAKPVLPTLEEEKTKAFSDVRRETDNQELKQKKRDTSEALDDDSLIRKPIDAEEKKRRKSPSKDIFTGLDTADPQNKQSSITGGRKPTAIVQTAGMLNKDDGSSSVNIVQDHFSQSGATKAPTQRSVKQQREDRNEQKDDDPKESSTNEKESILTAATGSAQSENWFITVDAITYKYMAEKYKKDIKDLEKSYNVKVKPIPSTPLEGSADQLYIELQTKSSRTNKATKSIDIPAAQAEFTRLYGDAFSNTKKEVITFKNLMTKEIKKAEDRLRKYQNMVSIWDGDGCTLCGEDAVVESAAEELRSALSGHESMTVDRIALKYLSTVHNDQLDLLKAKYNVTLDVQTAATEDQQTVLVKPIRKKKKKCTSQELSDAKDEFITLYQKIFFSTKRTAVKCSGISEEVIKDAVKLTKEKHVNMCGVNGAISEEVILCTEESIHDIVVREFRKLVGVAPKRRLRKTPSSDMEETKHTYKQSKDDEDGDKVKKTLPSVFITKEGMIIRAITDDLTKQTTDVIVNTANPTLSFDGGVSKAISTAAGPGLQRECKDILRGQYLGVGECLSSNSFNLSCKRVIHAVGPRYERNKEVFGNDLTKTLTNVLSMNEDEFCTKSIALPLISSGNLGGPKEYCAKVLVTALYDFSKDQVNRHLREVVLVNNEVETTSILQEVCAEVFKAWHQSSDNKNEKTQTSSTSISHFETSEGIDILIENGNITHAQVDIIVNAANKRLKHGRGVAGALSKAAGKELQIECDNIMSRRQSLKTGEFVVTSGYKLNARILHTVGPIYQEYSSDREFYQALRDTFIAAIRHANIPVEAKSIAIPLVSSGIYGGPKQMCADALSEAVEEFDKERNIVLEKIVLINLDGEATQALYRAFSKLYSECAVADTGFNINTESKTALQAGQRHSTLNGIHLDVLEGDITKQIVDVIINPTDEYLKHQVGVAKAVSDAAGQKFTEKCQDIMRVRKQRGRGQGPLQIDEVIETDGFGLNTKYILHTCSPIFMKTTSPSGRMMHEYHDMLRRKFEQCMLYANKKGGVSSVALPLMGAGNTGAPKDLCADALAKAISAFEVNEKHINLKCIVLVSNDKDAIEAVEKAFDKYFRDPYENHKGTVSRASVSDTNTWNQGSDDISYNSKPISRAGGLSHNAGYQTRNRDGYHQQVPIHHDAENPLHPGAIPKTDNSSWSIVSQQEVSNIQHSQQSSVISDYLVNPLKNLFGYNEKPVADMTRKSPKSSIHPSSMTSGDNRPNSNLVGHVDAGKSLDTNTKCLNCGVNYDLYPLGGCNHTFCKQCITKEIVPKSKCSACGTLFSIAEERELGGTMTYYTRPDLTLPGESGNGAIEIIFEFPDGTVEASEQHSGKRYKGRIFMAYLPNNADGLEVTLLLKTAFCQGLISRLRLNKRSSPKLMLSDLIPLKHNFKGGPKNYGYPDPDYLSRVKNALRDHHIVSSLSSDV